MALTVSLPIMEETLPVRSVMEVVGTLTTAEEFQIAVLFPASLSAVVLAVVKFSFLVVEKPVVLTPLEVSALVDAEYLVQPVSLAGWLAAEPFTPPAQLLWVKVKVAA